MRRMVGQLAPTPPRRVGTLSWSSPLARRWSRCFLGVPAAWSRSGASARNSAASRWASASGSWTVIEAKSLTCVESRGDKARLRGPDRGPALRLGRELIEGGTRAGSVGHHLAANLAYRGQHLARDLVVGAAQRTATVQHRAGDAQLVQVAAESTEGIRGTR